VQAFIISKINKLG